MTFETWDPSDIWSEWCWDKKIKTKNCVSFALLLKAKVPNKHRRTFGLGSSHSKFNVTQNCIKVSFFYTVCWKCNVDVKDKGDVECRHFLRNVIDIFWKGLTLMIWIFFYLMNHLHCTHLSWGDLFPDLWNTERPNSWDTPDTADIDRTSSFASKIWHWPRGLGPMTFSHITSRQQRLQDKNH